MNHLKNGQTYTQGYSDEVRANDAKTMFGFWVYLMTDFVLFASLFSVFIVLRGNPLGLHTSDLFEMRAVLLETLILLTSSFTCGMFLIAAHKNEFRRVLFWMFSTALLGAAFLLIEISEFRSLLAEGHGPSSSGFMSAFFTLVGTHGLHITVGLLWMAALVISILERGLVRDNLRKLMMLGMFWHFLDVIWIFIFTIVYLIGTV